MDMKELLAAENRPRLAVALMRISMGVMFLLASIGKVTAGGSWADRMLGFINFQQNTPQWYKGFLDSVVVPNAELFGFLTAYGELAIGLGLIFGLMARPALLFGVLAVANFALTKGTPFWTPSNGDSLYILIMLTLFFNHPGRFLGLDKWVAEKFPKIPT